MKKLTIAMLFISSLSAVAEEPVKIKFITTDFTTALRTAKSKGKILFVDAYATWCGP